MFPYQGLKGRVLPAYPVPTEDTLIEPFCGSARYALRYYEKEVKLFDVYDVIVRIWDYLIHATQKDIKSLPYPVYGDSLKDDKFKQLAQVERELLGFACAYKLSVPTNKVTKLADPRNLPRSHKLWVDRPSIWERLRKDILYYLPRIRHWTIEQKSYEEVPKQNVTWFIDPPYEDGCYYKYRNIDYTHLADWCRTLEGQVIVCEMSGAKWLPFVPLGVCSFGFTRTDRRKKTYEVYWTNKPVKQVVLF